MTKKEKLFIYKKFKTITIANQRKFTLSKEDHQLILSYSIIISVTFVNLAVFVITAVELSVARSTLLEVQLFLVIAAYCISHFLRAFVLVLSPTITILPLSNDTRPARL